MSTSASETYTVAVRASSLVIGAHDFTVCLDDGRRIIVPYRCYPRLGGAKPAARQHFEICAAGRMLRWPEIDEDIEVQHIVEGRMPVKGGREALAVAEEHAVYGSSIKSGRRKRKT